MFTCYPYAPGSFCDWPKIIYPWHNPVKYHFHLIEVQRGQRNNRTLICISLYSFHDLFIYVLFHSSSSNLYINLIVSLLLKSLQQSFLTLRIDIPLLCFLTILKIFHSLTIFQMVFFRFLGVGVVPWGLAFHFLLWNFLKTKLQNTGNLLSIQACTMKWRIGELLIVRRLLLTFGRYEPGDKYVPSSPLGGPF